MSSTLYNLDKPDEQADLELKDATQEELLKATYSAWLGATKEVRQSGRFGPGVERILYEQAFKIVKPLSQRISGAMTGKELDMLRYRTTAEEVDVRDACMYLSAVLNETKLKKILVDNCAFESHSLGKWLKPGKTIEIGEGQRAKYLAPYARGGTVINYGSIWGQLGLYASGGLWINFGKLEDMDMGRRASGGIWINFGEIEESDTESHMGWEATGGTWLNFGILEGYLGCNASNCVFVTKTEPKLDAKIWSDLEELYRHDHTLSCGVTSKDLKEEKVLSGLMDQIEQAGKKRHFGKVKKLARKVDAYVRKNYARRVV